MPATLDTISAQLKQATSAVEGELRSARTPAGVEALRVKYLGKKGVVSEVLRGMGALPAADRPKVGQVANEAKAQIEALLEKAASAVAHAAMEKELAAERLDVSLAGRRGHVGRRHPVSRTLDDMVEVLRRLGFEVASGPEIETDFNNFEALNIPPDHPARDMQDTFYVEEGSLGGKVTPGSVILRTHTSPVQVRTMQARKPPVRIIAPGKVYRCDSDLTHTPMFHQVEGLYVDTRVTFAELKGTLDAFCKAFFGPKTQTRFRPSYFPFTEPSLELDATCVSCGGKGCRICKGTGFLELMGAGMVHPNVFRAVGYDPDKVSGFAFGMGIERIAMLRYGVDDLRLLFENDERFLEQF